MSFQDFEAVRLSPILRLVTWHLLPNTSRPLALLGGMLPQRGLVTVGSKHPVMEGSVPNESKISGFI